MTDPLIDAARFLQSQLEWMRHATADNGEAYAVAAFAEIDWCAGRLRGLVNGPAEQKYLGPCGADPGCTGLTAAWCPTHGDCACSDDGTRDPHISIPLDDPQCPLHSERSPHPGQPCEGDIYAPRGAKVGRCRTCKAEVATADRQEWLDAQVGSSDLAWTAIGIAHALGLSVKTIRSWATERHAPNGVILRRAKLATYWHNGSHLVPWVDPLPGEDVKARGDRLHYVADVAQLAEEAAQRRVEEQRQQPAEEDAA